MTSQPIRLSSVRNSCAIKVFWWRFYVVTLRFGLFCGCRCFCHRIESDLFLFLFHQFHDLYTKLNIHRLRVVFMEHLQWMWHASRERLPFRTPGSVTHCGTCLCPNCCDQISRICHVFTRLFSSNTPWYFLDFACNSREERGTSYWLIQITTIELS